MICNLSYLTEMMDGKNHLIKGILDAFLEQFPGELQCINEAVTKTDYITIKSVAHTMKSSVSIVGISILNPVLKEIEDLALHATDIEKIKRLTVQLNLISGMATEEIERDKLNYC